MKKILTLATIATIGLASFSSCSKSSSSPSYTMKATVASASYNASYCTATVIGAGSDSVLTIIGYNGSATAITYPIIELTAINWNGKTGTTTYDSTGVSGSGDYLTSASSYDFSKSGSLVITSVTSTTIQGTYSFTTSSGVVVSGGNFTAKRQ